MTSKTFRGCIDNCIIITTRFGDVAYGTLVESVNEDRNIGLKVGCPIRTSIIVKQYEEDGSQFIETLNSVYELLGLSKE